MAKIIGSDQISLVDLTDAYSVILTSESHTFLGTKTTAKAGSTTTQVVAMCGADIVACSVVLNEITKPTGVTVTKDSNATSPTLTIAVSTSVTADGTVTIPVHIGDITINKTFSFGIAFTGADGTSVTVSEKSVTYQAGTNGTTAPTGTWLTSIPNVPKGQYLWTKTVVSYSDGKNTEAYSVSYIPTDGNDGTSVEVESQAITYQSGTSGTTKPTGSWSTTIPNVAKGNFLWTKTVVTYTDGKSTESYSVSYIPTDGEDGQDGADAIVVKVTSSNGTIFKNTSIDTVLTAHVYKAGTELTETQISALGTVKWYKSTDTATVLATGVTYTIDAGDVTNNATFFAQLES